MLLVATFLVRPFSVPSISMIPTLRVEDTVLVDVAAYRFARPRAGDLAVFMAPLASRVPFIKRVIGIPGDSIRITDGVLYRNGVAVHEPYVNEPTAYDLDIARDDIYVNDVALDPTNADIPPKRMWQAPNRVPAGFYLVLGDNRNYSDDSHMWGFAPFDGRFIGKAIMVIWPPSDIRILR